MSRVSLPGKIRMEIPSFQGYNGEKTPVTVMIMKRTPIVPKPEQFPEEFRPLLCSCPVYDSSCSPEARVLFLDREGGLYLKSAPSGTLKTEGEMTAFFHSKGLSAEVLAYLPEEKDWLLTRAIAGEDCTFHRYLEDPVRLCDTTATLLRQLHEVEIAGCPVTDQNARRFHAAQKGYAKQYWENDLFAGMWDFSSREEAWNAAREALPCLRSDVLLHGDYCLPNVLLKDWKFSGFIDVGSGGIGDRHIDLLWGIWTLMFNLKTNQYSDRFLDAYGRDKAVPALLRGIAAIETFG